MKKISVSKKKKTIITACICVLLAAGIGIYTFSKFASQEAIDGTIELEEFYAVARVYYEDENGTEQEATINFDDSDSSSKYLELTPEQFETVRVDIEYTGEARTYCRFKMDCSWLKDVTETYNDTTANGELTSDDYTLIIPQPYPTVEVADNVYNNVQSDGWFYIKDIMEGEGENVEVVHAIESITPTGNFKDPIVPDDQIPDRVQIMVTVDCVQYNRVSALWKMDSLPWWGN